ncbi:glutamate racemase [Aquibacillus salsiterrae]|uniref:Glutamate racemase n=1 Tax=Aquibacillus salsiterrae TaxID=2950439 RepID=A0A9X3WDZ7_9BACI|nr:glutamate racemase [Aquibacillus salsiterrae]MDC3415699.1 glutamate racemase [Aquibacillus salsiterrae]
MDQPIGVIDSGVGGLTVASELIRQLPKEQLIYLGDTLRCPYGPRPKQEVVEYTWEMVDFLLNKNIKMLVVACNTATAYTLDELRANLSIPVIGVIQPGARAAIKMTNNRRIGVIGTEGTINSKAYPLALQSINSNIVVNDLACPKLAPMVEEGNLTGSEAYDIVYQSLKPLKDKNHIDTLILGCTHYPLVKDLIQEVIGKHVHVISSGEETAREISTILSFNKKLYNGTRIPKHQFFTTGRLHVFESIANKWLQQPLGFVKNINLSEKSFNK